MFWGLIMEPQRRYSQKVKKAFHVSMAALDVSTSSDEPAQVMCGFEGRNYLLCTLKKPDLLQCPLDLSFDVGSDLSFVTNGKCHVHLTGYLTDDFADLSEDDDSDEEPLLEEKDVKKKTASKRNTEINGPPSKKSKLSKKVEEEEEEDSEDSDVDVAALLQKSFDEDEEDDDDTYVGEEEDDDDAVSAEENEEDEDSDIEEEEDEDDDEDDDDSSSLSEDENEQPANASPSKNKVKMNGIQVKPENATPKTKKEKKKKRAQETQEEVKKEQKSPKEAKKSKKEQQTASPKKKVLQGGVIIEELKEGDGPSAKSGKFVSVRWAPQDIIVGHRNLARVISRPECSFSTLLELEQNKVVFSFYPNVERVYYEGRLKQNNKVFDSTNKGAGFSFRLGAGEVIKAWDVGVMGMKLGGKRRILCPPAMAYGLKGSPPAVPANSTLVFEVELKKIR